MLTQIEGPTFELDAEDDREYTLEEWLNLNPFVARLFSTTVGEFVNSAIWELRNGLEEVWALSKDIEKQGL
jgi:hypothetical protein